VTLRSVSAAVTQVIDACAHEEAVLDYLWMVMEADDDGCPVDNVVGELFGGDPSALVEARTLTDNAWREGGGAELAPELVHQTRDDRLVMFPPARAAIYELLDTD
jgi:hypothetical protein